MRHDGESAAYGARLARVERLAEAFAGVMPHGARIAPDVRKSPAVISQVCPFNL